MINNLFGNALTSPDMLGLLGLSSGLLAAGAPSTTPNSFGSALGRGLMGGIQSYGQGLQQQVSLNKLQKEQQQMDALANLYKRSAGAGGTAPSGSNRGVGPTLEELGQAAAAGVKIDDFLKLWELQNPAMQVHNGVAFDPRNIPSGPVQQVQVTPQGQAINVTPNPGGGAPSVSALPGSLSTFTQFQDAAEAAKARRDPFLGITDAQGRVVPMTREGFATRYGDVSLSNPSGTTSPGAPRGVGQTPGEKTSQITTAEGDAKTVLGLEAKIPSLLSVQRRLDRMAALTGDEQTYAAAGAELKSTLGSIAQSFGLKVNESKTANTEEYLAHVAELLKDRLASKDYGSGTGVSNLDLLSAQRPLPELAKTAAGRIQLINALKADTERNLTDAKAARDYFDANSGLRGFRYPSEVEANKKKLADDLPKTPGTPPAGATPRVLKYDPVTRTVR